MYIKHLWVNTDAKIPVFQCKEDTKDPFKIYIDAIKMNMLV